MSSKDQYRDYAKRYKQESAKLKLKIDALDLALQQQKDINLAARNEIRGLKTKISKTRFWRDLFGMKTP